MIKCCYSHHWNRTRRNWPMKAAYIKDEKQTRLEDEIDYVPNADVISLETLVNILVKKGICTADELFILERRVQQSNQKNHHSSFVPIQNQYDRGKFPGLKKTLSKYKWSRRLGSLIFGWKWRKVKKNGSH